MVGVDLLHTSALVPSADVLSVGSEDDALVDKLLRGCSWLGLLLPSLLLLLVREVRILGLGSLTCLTVLLFLC